MRTEVLDLERVLTADSTTASAGNTIPPLDLTVANPVKADVPGLWTPGVTAGGVPNSGIIMPVGTNADGEVGLIHAFGLKKVGAERWTHLPGFSLDFTLGSLVTGETDEFYADTLSFSTNLIEAVDMDPSVSSDMVNCGAFVRWDLLGCMHWRFLFELGATGPVASLNAFVGGY
jgi:hypothetical protein